MIKRYYCAICNKDVNRNNRLVHQKWGLSRFGDFANINHYDFCDDCFKIFENWIKKHEGGKNGTRG